MVGNTIKIKLAFGEVSRSNLPLYQFDYGQILQIEGVELPDAYEVHFSNSVIGTSKTSVGNADGVSIPDEFLLSGEDIHLWLFLHTGEDDGETEYEGLIKVYRRAEPTDIQPTPVQQDVITQTIAALNAAVDKSETNVTHYPKIVDRYWYVWDAENEEWVNTNVIATPDAATIAQTREIINDYEE